MKKATIEGERPKRNKDHDDFLRGLFGYTEFVLKILQYSVPNDLKQYIDFSTLKKFSETHVSDELDITYSDTIYEVALNKDAIPKSIRRNRKMPNFRFCFLGEFKSGIPDRPIDFQIEGYVRSIQLVDINNKQPPSIVVPILIYHGAKKWYFKRLYDYFAKYLPNTILEYISFPKYIVIDLQAMSDADIAAALDLDELRAAFMALKHAHDKDFFQNNLEEIFTFVENSRPSLLFQTYLKMLLEYSQRRSKLDNKKFNTVIEQLNPDKKMATRFKTIFEVAEEKGMAKGVSDTKREVIEELIRTTDWKDVQIAKVVKVPLTLVVKIRQELQQVAA